MQESNKRLKTKRTIENAMVQLLMEQPFDKNFYCQISRKSRN
ncbi:TetR family transcriptional regulator [Streptococcus pneumoniae]|nr:TetR family transcriptional regulator [Streptococcus pneumoniae]